MQIQQQIKTYVQNKYYVISEVCNFDILCYDNIGSTVVYRLKYLEYHLMRYINSLQCMYCSLLRFLICGNEIKELLCWNIIIVG